jgi:hypothetical protein
MKKKKRVSQSSEKTSVMEKVVKPLKASKKTCLFGTRRVEPVPEHFWEDNRRREGWWEISSFYCERR